VADPRTRVRWRVRRTNWAPRMTPRPQVRLLNAFDLTSNGQSVALPMSAQRVLAFVALHDRPVQRPYVAGSLWLETPEERAHANLRSALWRLHNCGVRLVDATSAQLSLARHVRVDLRESETLARETLDATNGGHDVPTAAFSGDVLPDWYDDWVILERERYRQLRLRALDALCDRLTLEGRLGAALEAGLAAVASEPLRESAHRAVIRVHLAEGNVGEAIRQYRLCRRLLHDQLGIEPSERIAELMGGVLDVETVRGDTERRRMRSRMAAVRTRSRQSTPGLERAGDAGVTHPG
jgi:DNA-binding SARP family transcriptional activator